MRRRRAAKSVPSDSSDDEPLAKTVPKKAKSTPPDDSSSESDIETYLQPAHKIDLDSEFFNPQKEPPSFDQIESNILSGVAKLSDSEDEEIEVQATPSTSKVNFGQLHEYAKKIEEAKRQVEEYNARKKKEEKETNVEKLLAAGESNEKSGDILENLHSSDFESCSDSDKEGWEEVKEQKEKSLVPKEGIEITVGVPTNTKKKKDVDVLAVIKRRINRVRKENQVLVHKVHLLCWIAHGNFVNSQINSQNVLGVALSLLPSEKCYPPNRTDLSYLEQITKWFNNTVVLAEKEVPKDKTLEELIQEQVTKKTAYNKTMLVYIFVAILRSLGVACRLVLSLQVEPLRPPNSELLSLSTKNNEKKGETSKDKIGESSKEQSDKNVNIETKKEAATKVKKIEDKKQKVTPLKKAKSKEPLPKKSSDKNKALPVVNLQRLKKLPKPRSPEKTISPSKKEAATTVKKVEDEKQKVTPLKKAKSKESPLKKSAEKNKALPVVNLQRLKESSKPQSPEKTNTRSKSKAKPAEKPKTKPDVIKIKLPSPKKSRSKSPQTPQVSIPQLDGANDSPPKPNLKKLKDTPPPCPIRNHPKRLKSVTKYRDSDSEEDFTAKTLGANLKKLKNRATKKGDVTEVVKNLVEKSIKEMNDLTRKPVKKRSGKDDDSDYVLEEIKKKHHDSDDEFSPKVKVKRRVQVRREPEVKVKKKGVDVWAEVFCENEEKWICVDVVKAQIHCTKELYSRASQPVTYIVAWSNDNTLKDVTRRYCPTFNTITRKLRIDEKWWTESLKPFMGPRTARDIEEDDEMDRQHLEKPLPTTISEYKNHPLYALKRHLLKFEAIYPPDAPTVGFIRNEPVYLRRCIYTLHSREIWLKHAKVVKPGEQPYKIVKARPKWDKLSNSLVTGEMLEIFGPWQTQDYDPPTAENGIVPRNAFGNVELFKPCMLPKKTVHLQLPGLNKVARKLNIDCAPALTGFDFHGGWNHPVYDGYIVCEEFADVLVAAWDQEQQEIEKREQEKIDKRVYGNWKRLIKGLLIRERLKVKYEFGETSSGGGGSKKKGKGLPKLATKKRKMETGGESD